MSVKVGGPSSPGQRSVPTLNSGKNLKDSLLHLQTGFPSLGCNCFFCHLCWLKASLSDASTLGRAWNWVLPWEDIEDNRKPCCN